VGVQLGLADQDGGQQEPVVELEIEEKAQFLQRLKIVDPTTLPSLDEVWSAHRLRNMIAHDPLEQHTRETIMAALRSYKRALKDLGLLEETAPSSPPPKVS